MPNELSSFLSLSKFSFSTAVLLGLLFASPNLQAVPEPCIAVGNNVISNCGFENSATLITPWVFTTSGISGSLVTVDTLNGVRAFEMKTVNAATQQGTLTQSLTGLSAGVYNLSFYYHFKQNDSAQFASIRLLGPVDFAVLNLAPNVDLSLVSFSGINLLAGNYTLEVKLFGPTPGAPALFRVDSFVLTTPVPEPATMIMLGSLCSAVAGYKWTRRNT